MHARIYNRLQNSKTELRSESSLAVTSLIAPNRDGERSVPENCAERESRSHGVNEIDPTTSCIVLEPFKGLGHRACSQADRHDHNRKVSCMSDGCRSVYVLT